MSIAFFNRVISTKPLFFSLLIAIIFGVFFVAAWYANTDLTEGRFALYNVIVSLRFCPMAAKS